MTLTQNPTVVSIYDKANKTFQQRSGLTRWGQTLWNTAEDYIKKNCSTETIEKLNNLKSTDRDCYYSDLRTENFIQALNEIFKDDILKDNNN